MIVRIAKNGRSFKGSGLYYLHDKAADPGALEYEKEMGRIWCENRVENTKPREERQPDRSANDNDLPHNVIKLSRPFERDYAASEKAREEVFARERDLLKREQRHEREAWFADGKDLFKETRNAVWREVKQEYREDWKQFCAEKAVREHDASSTRARRWTGRSISPRPAIGIRLGRPLPIGTPFTPPLPVNSRNAPRICGGARWRKPASGRASRSMP